MNKGAFPRIFPFALFMGFIGLEELARFLTGWGLVHQGEGGQYLLYPVKALAVGLTLLFFKSRYSEIKISDLSIQSHTAMSIFTGLLVFVLWIHMDWPFATFGKPAGYNPTIFEDKAIRSLMIASRLTGAVLVVPAMEELFWSLFSSAA